MLDESKQSISASEAKLHFGEILNRAIYGKEPVVITKHGKPVAVLIDKDEWEEKQEQKSENEKLPDWFLEAQKLRESIAKYRKKHNIKDTTDAVQLIREMRDSR